VTKTKGVAHIHVDAHTHPYASLISTSIHAYAFLSHVYACNSIGQKMHLLTRLDGGGGERLTRPYHLGLVAYSRTFVVWSPEDASRSSSDWTTGQMNTSSSSVPPCRHPGNTASPSCSPRSHAVNCRSSSICCPG
jgi:hypothetical protein